MIYTLAVNLIRYSLYRYSLFIIFTKNENNSNFYYIIFFYIRAEYLNIIIEQDPLYEKAWISIAKYYLRKNDHDKAIENLNKALNIISNNY